MDAHTSKGELDGLAVSDGAIALDGAAAPDGTGSPDGAALPDGTDSPDGPASPDGASAPDVPVAPDRAGATDGATLSDSTLNKSRTLDGRNAAGTRATAGSCALMRKRDCSTNDKSHLSPGCIRASAAGVRTTALVRLAVERAVTQNGAIEPLARCVTGGAKALYEPAVISALDVA